MARRLMKKPKITKRGQYWVVDFYDVEGRRIRRFHKTKNEAAECAKKAAKTRDTLTQESVFVKPIQTIQVEIPKQIKPAILYYLKNVSKQKSCEDSEMRYLYSLKDFLCDQNKLEWLDEVRPIFLKSFQMMRSKVVANSTVNREFSTIKHFFRQCLIWELIEKNPCEFIQMLPESPTTRSVWSDEEFKVVLNKLGQKNESLKNSLYFMAETGARNSEMINLEWQDVDLLKCEVTLRHKKGSKALLRSRTIPLSKDLYQLLLKEKEKALTSIVFPGKDGKKQGRNSLAQIVRRATRSLGMSNKTPYGLRHTLGTKVAEHHGVDVAKELLGHTKLTTTQKYLHTSSERLKKAVNESSIRRTQPVNNGHETACQVLPFVAKKRDGGQE